MEILLRTPVGSRLYGLDSPDSDFDYYTVVKLPEGEFTNKAKYQRYLDKVVPGVDETISDLSTFMELAKAGHPQALEAMFSQMTLVDRIEGMRAAFVAGSFKPYLGIMENIRDKFPDSYKHKRHVLRLANNVKSIRARGRFNPTLTVLERELINSLAKMPMDKVYNDAMIIAGL